MISGHFAAAAKMLLTTNAAALAGAACPAGVPRMRIAAGEAHHERRQRVEADGDEAVAGDRRDDQVERIGRIPAARRRVGQRADDLHELHH
jgi:hypothetical protein